MLQVVSEVSGKEVRSHLALASSIQNRCILIPWFVCVRCAAGILLRLQRVCGGSECWWLVRSVGRRSPGNRRHERGGQSPCVHQPGECERTHTRKHRSYLFDTWHWAQAHINHISVWNTFSYTDASWAPPWGGLGKAWVVSFLTNWLCLRQSCWRRNFSWVAVTPTPPALERPSPTWET